MCMASTSPTYQVFSKIDLKFLYISKKTNDQFALSLLSQRCLVFSCILLK